MIEKILNTVYCGDLFEEDEKKIREKYRELVKQIHPDVCSDPHAQEAFANLKRLYNRALECIHLGCWDETDTLRLPGRAKIHYLHSKPFELGKRFVTDNQVIWVFDSTKDKYFKQYMHTKLTYKDKRMETIYREKMPVVEDFQDRAIFVKRDPREFPMDLFLLAYQKKLTARDIAWMVSRMCDLLCFLNFNKIAINAITPENLFINADTHSISIYGGWWYSAKIGEKMTGVSKSIFDIMPFSVRSSKLSSPITDVEGMRIMFQRICKDKELPDPFKKWLEAGSLDDPIQEYERWNEALDKSWGKRQFMKFEAKADEIYSQY
ncbi:MAG: J domain-containing protein [Bacteroidota bacterium]|nr:J domain-containing protein [Bacteroidota bacterium]